MFASQSAAQARAASRVTGLASALARGPCRNVPTTTTTMQLRTRRQKSFGAPSSGSCRRHESSPRPALELPAPLQTRPFSTTRQASIMTSPSSAAAAANGPGGSRARTVDMKVKQDAADQSLLAREDPAAAAATMRTMPTFSLEGKVCVVTGGARGLGLVMGNGVVQSGADLAIVDLNVEEAEKQAKLVVEEYMAASPAGTRPPRVTAHFADVSSADSVSDCLAGILAAHNGRVDHLVTSAGFVENFPATEYPIDRMRKLWGVNVDGTYLFAVAVARHLMERKEGGSMVLIGSMSGAIVNVPQPQAPYNISKAAVRHLAATLAVEWAEHGIRVNCISPGYMLTALTQRILDEKQDLKQRWTSMIPQGRMGNPDDLTGPVVFLLSDASRYVNGADLRVDGAYTVI